MTRSLSIRARLVLGMVVLVSVGLAVANVDRDPAAARPTSSTASTSRSLHRRTRRPTRRRRRRRRVASCARTRGTRADSAATSCSLVLDADGAVACSLGPDLGDAVRTWTRSACLDRRTLGHRRVASTARTLAAARRTI